MNDNYLSVSWVGGELGSVELESLSSKKPRGREANGVLQFSCWEPRAALFLTVEEARQWAATLLQAADWWDLGPLEAAE